MPYTRISEYKHLTGQVTPRPDHLRISRRPRAIPTTRSRARRTRRCTSATEALADATPDVTFVGRLATYRYYNMDQVVGQALATFRRMDDAALASMEKGRGRRLRLVG